MIKKIASEIDLNVVKPHIIIDLRLGYEHKHYVYISKYNHKDFNCTILSHKNTIEVDAFEIQRHYTLGINYDGYEMVTIDIPLMMYTIHINSREYTGGMLTNLGLDTYYISVRKSKTYLNSISRLINESDYTIGDDGEFMCKLSLGKNHIVIKSNKPISLSDMIGDGYAKFTFDIDGDRYDIRKNNIFTRIFKNDRCIWSADPDNNKVTDCALYTKKC